MTFESSSLVLWLGFLGAWLLVTGPIYQASIELSEFDEKHRQLAPRSKETGNLPRMSAWWWLFPPLGYAMYSKRAQDRRVVMMRAASQEAVRTYNKYSELARGWLIVAGGAFLIALKETAELAEHDRWLAWVPWIAVPAMLVLAALPASVRTRKSRRQLDPLPAPRQGAP